MLPVLQIEAKVSDFYTVFKPHLTNTDSDIDKNGMKEIFLKKLQICMKTYDYNDETKDVKGKVGRLDVHQLEREDQCHKRAPIPAVGPKERDPDDYSKS